jgi:hypothetical protein
MGDEDEEDPDPVPTKKVRVEEEGLPLPPLEPPMRYNSEYAEAEAVSARLQVYSGYTCRDGGGV